MYDFAHIFRRLYGATVTDSPEGRAAMAAAEARYDAFGELAERMVERCRGKPPASPSEPPANPSEAPTKTEMREWLTERLRA